MKYQLLIALVGLAATVQAQSPEQGAASPEMTALRSCVTLADEGKAADAATQGTTAETLFRQRIARNPRDTEALVGAARALSQCLVPSAEFMRQGELSSEALDLLDQALEIQPDHWLARYVLASISYRSPPFLGRGKRAATEFDELLRRQGDRTDNPMFARVFVMRGMQLSREGQADTARALWVRGAALFPADAELRKLAARVKADTTHRPADSVRTTAARTVMTIPSARADSSASSELSAVKVMASSAPRRVPHASVKDVTRSQVLTTAGGAADVLQSVQMQPGATRVAEGGDVYTRGGDASETSLFMNGGRLLSIGRFEGLNGSMFGAIEPFVVKSVRYYSGGFSAKYGNALSGVLEIETDGRPRERQTRAGLSLVQASGTIRTPIGQRAGGWLSTRVSHTGPLLRTHGRTGEFSGSPQSQELIASVIAAPNALTEYRATALVERDESRRHLSAAGWRGAFESRGDVRALMLTSRWMSATAPLVLRGSLTGNTRSNEWAFGVLSRDREESTVGTRIDAEWQATSSLNVRGGIEQGAHRRIESGTVPVTESVAIGAPVRELGDARSSASQAGAYSEAEFASGPFALTGGVRLDRLPGESELTVDPRLALAARAGLWTVRVSGGVFHQGRWRGNAAIPDVGTPSGLPGQANHLVLGVEREGNTGLLRAEIFSKRYRDYRSFGVGPAIRSAETRGLELIAQRLTGKMTGFVGYSLLDATSELESGQRVRGAFDITHSATGSITVSLLQDWSIGTTGRYGTGAPRTPIVGSQKSSDGQTRPVYGALMSDRLPAYARLDSRVMRYIRMPAALLTTYVEVLNLTNRANVATFTYDPSYTSREAVHTFFARRTLVIGGELMFR
jgi:hypothetical protein